MPELLITSYIKPWRDCNDNERLDRCNGLTLAPRIDALLDSGLITFKGDGNVTPNKRFLKGNLSRLSVILEEKLEAYPDSKKYLE